VDLAHGIISSKINPKFRYSDILHLGPSSFPKSTHRPGIYSQTREFENNSKKVPSLRKSPKIAPKLQKFISFQPQLQNQ
jgi:hypothetical protein